MFLEKYPLTFFVKIVCLLALLGTEPGLAQEREIPDVLKPWQDWVTWGDEHRDCPKLYSSANEPVCFWPSRLELEADDNGATWSIDVSVFDESWIPLPGASELWPVEVRVGEELVVIVERDGRPAVKLPKGEHQISGEFRWESMPQRIAIPSQMGILSLTVSGNEIPIPNWDAKGEVWLKRAQSAPADKDMMNLKVYRVIEDGIPLWLRTDIELTVSGKSREEQLGWILPQGWQISTVESQIPVAIDDRGVMKAQVRAGKWVVAVHAFRTTDPGEIGFATAAEPAAPTELVALKIDPEFRIAQIEGLPTVDVTQTTLPSKWRGLPVYLWDTTQPFQLAEKMRGMGEKSPEGLTINRRLWLDEDGKNLTYRDQLRGKMQRIWRLDVADGYELGAVRIDGEGQLITANPQTGASGVEIRKRNLDLHAVGRAPRISEIAATGWQTDAESLRLTLTLPPGWRVFAIFGADRVEGDWLTAWSLLDLFLLLIFSLAVFRMYGFTAGIVALLAFGLAYHEPAAPRFTWLFLLLPLALLRVVGDGAGKKWIIAWKYVALTFLLLSLIPFIALQLQGAIYPQLERPGMEYGSRSVFGWTGVLYTTAATQIADSAPRSAALLEKAPSRAKQIGIAISGDASNLLYDPKSRIQTGPAEPTWNWNNVQCIWNGPVTSQQQIRPILISLPQHRILTVLRVVLLMLLGAILLGSLKLRLPLLRRKTATSAAALALLLTPAAATAQIPEQEMLEELRQRLLETSDAFPNAAEIPSVDLNVTGNQVEMGVTVHAAADVAVPLPGRLPAWSPVSVTMDGDSDVRVARRDGYLWVLVPRGVHEVTVKGLLGVDADWQWTFLLQPKYVSIDAEGWKVTGVNRDGVPDAQVFFAREQAATDDEAAYDRTDFNPIVVVDRYLEIGLEPRVRTTVTRLSQEGKAVSLDVPLLDGEGVLTANREISDAAIAVRMGASQTTFAWDGELPMEGEIRLSAPETNQWVERWHLVTSPVWNVAFAGLAPVFEPDQEELIPVWHPWPGESVILSFSRPLAIVGDIMTVKDVKHEVSIGSRQRTSKLTLDLECSLASDFVVELDSESEITTLKQDSQSIPVQRDGGKIIIPAHPGKQNVVLEWKTPETMDQVVEAGTILLPVEASNITSVIQMPENRWVLWADGPLRGPAVRFWTILAIAILAAVALGSVKITPLRRWEWVLLAIGLTQVHLVPAMIVVGWLFLLAWRGNLKESDVNVFAFNVLQLFIIFLTFVSLIVLMFVVGAGLLGSPDMFIVGNGSTRTYLQWFQPRSGQQLPSPYVVSISVWFYRLLMLFWALWLASALLRWLKWGWNQFSEGGVWRRGKQREVVQATLVTPAGGSQPT